MKEVQDIFQFENMFFCFPIKFSNTFKDITIDHFRINFPNTEIPLGYNLHLEFKSCFTAGFYDQWTQQIYFRLGLPFINGFCDLITHEVIHDILCKEIGEEASSRFDNLRSEPFDLAVIKFSNFLFDETMIKYYEKKGIFLSEDCFKNKS